MTISYLWAWPSCCARQILTRDVRHRPTRTSVGPSTETCYSNSPTGVADDACSNCRCRSPSWRWGWRKPWRRVWEQLRGLIFQQFEKHLDVLIFNGLGNAWKRFYLKKVWLTDLVFIEIFEKQFGWKIWFSFEKRLKRLVN